MAKKAKQKGGDEDDAPDAAEAPAGGGKKKLIIIVAVLLLAGGGGGGWFFMKKKHTAETPVVEVKKPVAFLDVADLVVNLAQEKAEEKPRLLRLKVALEMKDANVVNEVKPLMPRVQDIFQVFMRELRASDLEGSGGIHRLREELLRRVNLAVFPSKVDAVLFKEVIVQ